MINYIKLVANGNLGGASSYYGIAEIRFYDNAGAEIVVDGSIVESHTYTQRATNTNDWFNSSSNPPYENGGAGNEQIIMNVADFYVGAMALTSWGNNGSAKTVDVYASEDNIDYTLKGTITFDAISQQKRIELTKYRYLFQDGEEIKKYEASTWSVVGSAPVTKALFDAHGMTSLSSIAQEALDQLTSPTPELLVWTEEESANKNLNLTAVPLPQVVYPVGDLEIGEIDNIQLSKVISGEKTAVPKLTGPDSKVSRSSAYTQYNVVQEGWRAFAQDIGWNGSYTEYHHGWCATAASGWIQYDFTNPIEIGQVALVQYGLLSAVYRCGDFKIQCSNDNTTWNDAFVGKAENNFNRQLFVFPPIGAYRYWRLTILNNPSGGNCGITGLEFLPPLRSDLKIIASGDGGSHWNTFDGSAWLTIDPLGTELDTSYIDKVPKMTSNTSPEGKVEASSTHSTTQPYWAFDKINVSEGNSPWITNATQSGWLSYEFSAPKRIEKYTIMGQMSGGTTTDANLIARSPKSWTFEGWDGSQWIVLDTQSNITSWSIGQKKEFMFTNPNTYSKYRINVSANCGNAYLAIGEMEMMEKIENEVPIIKNRGISPANLNAITQDQWAQLMTNGTLRLAYYLEQSSTSDVCQIDSLAAKENVVTLTPAIQHLGVNYELLEGRRPTYYASRNDGVTWKEVKVDQLTSLSDQPSGTKLRIKAVMNDGEEIYGIAYSWM